MRKQPTSYGLVCEATSCQEETSIRSRLLAHTSNPLRLRIAITVYSWKEYNDIRSGFIKKK
jgi:hypothetical protein